VLAVEVKLKGTPDDDDVRHLNWLSKQLGDEVIDRVILTTGKVAYRRKDGVAVIPGALLGPEVSNLVRRAARGKILRSMKKKGHS
jgi:hypothetical protein